MMKIYDSSVQDIENRIHDLSRQYTPEWHFSESDPDIGSAIAKIFSLQMQENVGLVNRMMERYHAEFINMLDISLKSAKPAGSMVQFNLIENSVPGTTVRKGTRLVADTVGVDEPVIFETDREIYVTNSVIRDAFMTDREDGTLVPLLGDFKSPPLIEGTEIRGEEEEEQEEEENTVEMASSGEEERTNSDETVRSSIRPFVLFSEEGNIAKSALILYHESVFDLEDEPIYIRLSGNQELNEKILSREYRFRYYTKDGFREFDSIKLLPDKETFELIKSKENRKFALGSKEYAVVVLEAMDKVKDDVELDDITLSSSGRERGLDYVNDGSTDMDTDRFAPFTDTLAVYNECYLGQDVYFSKAGAYITISFSTSFQEKGLYLTRQEEEVSLKIIKKKPKVIPSDIPADAYADEIGLEYFNGMGWRKLHTIGDVSGLFREAKAGDHEIKFICPSDWVSVQSGAYTGRCIRMRLLKSDNCFLRPGMHHYPIISNVKISFSYQGHFVQPEKLYLLAGTKKKDITLDMKGNKSFIVMSGGKYSRDGLYLGFDRKMESGPVSLYFELSDVLNTSRLKCCFEYATYKGFKRMKVVDQTYDFSRSGVVMFMPPSDMQFTTLEEKRRIWIRIRRERNQSENESRLFLPRIQRVLLNVVNVSNIITGSEENYYMTEAVPNMHFPLPNGHILDAEVWVNEKDTISEEEIERIQAEDCDRIRVEYDVLGNISAAYVKWDETGSFLDKEGRRVYVIDRVSHEIIFADGIKADIPRVVDDISFKVRVRLSDGSDGNVAAGRINEVAGTELYIDNVVNPVRAYGGSNPETVREALRRGANIIYGRGRLVTMNDYKWTILNYSDSIDKVACIPWKTINGKHNDQDISFVLLMRDFMDGSFSFHRISGELKDHLLKHSSITYSEEHLHIVEPIFVSISVSVWAEVKNLDDSFEVQNMYKDSLYKYFDPVSNEEDNGWEIGVIPKKSQIMMRLGAVKTHAVISKTVIIANYVDKDGEHETDISDLEVTPFMVVRNGEHKVNVSFG
ncbi:MAG: hypothetical protein K5668_10250 [Lachnospiraceae bacterium]|nr:hypothetical protein [Lachnospiraceae bacterium]